MRPWNNRESQRGAGSISERVQLRTAVAVAAAKAQPTLKCAWMCVRCSVKIPRGPREKNVAVAERREGGPVTLDLTKLSFNKADRRNKCRNLVGNSKPLLLIGSPIDSGRENKERARAVLHLAFICELYEIQVHGGRTARRSVFPSRTLAFRRQLGSANSCGLQEQVS